MSVTKKANQRHKKSAALAAKTTPEQLNEEFEQMVNTASAWCADHAVILAITPVDALRLRRQRDAVRAAVLAAGGRTKVPEAVLLYEQTLEDAASFMLAHGVGRALTLLINGKGF